MYFLYFDDLPFPILPQKVSTKIKGNNKTITLINEGEVNQIKTSRLTEITFDLLLPNKKYPFGYYPNGFQPASYYLAKLEELKKSPDAFKFKLVRQMPNHTDIYTTDLPVTLEEYTIEDDADELFDNKVSITLKKYVEYGTHKITVKKKSGKTKVKKSKKRGKSKKKKATSYTVKKGDTLYLIAKKKTGDASKRKQLYKKNKAVIEAAAKKHGLKGSANGHWIFPGTKLKIPK